MIRGLLSGCFAAFWMQFAMNLADKVAGVTPESAPAPQSAEDQARVDQILARCAAADQAAREHTPEIVARWVEFVYQHDLPIVVVSRNQAIVPSLTRAPKRVH
jgi:hypothetical protein